MKKAILNARTAAALMAYKFSDVIEFDSSFFADAKAALNNEYEDRIQNLFGQQTKLFDCEGTEDVLGVMYGAMKGGAVASGFVKDTGYLDLAKLSGKYWANDLPAVFYVGTNAANACSYGFDPSIGMIFPQDAQEAADLSVLAHLSIGKSYKPFVVCLDTANDPAEAQKLELPENADINKLFDVVAFCGTRARALKRGISCDIEVPVLLEAELPEIVQHYLSMIEKEWKRSYKAFEYVGSPKAEKVFVAAGPVAKKAAEAVEKMAAAGEKVGLVSVRILAPFNAKEFTKAFPKSAKLAVLVGQDGGACPRNPLFKAVKAAAPALKWTADELGLGRKSVSAEFIENAYAELANKAPKAKNDNKKYFAGAMDDKAYAAQEAVLDLGKKRWVIANTSGVNNVDFGLGMTAAFEQRRDWILNEVLFLADNTIFPSVSDRGYEYLEVKDDTKKSLPALKALLADKVGADTHCSTCTNIRQELEFLDRKYYWIFGGDSRKSELDWKAIRKALTSGENVNILCVQEKAIYKKAAEHTGAKDVFFRVKNIDGVMAKTITLDMDKEKIEGILRQAETHFGPSIVVLFV